MQQRSFKLFHYISIFLFLLAFGLICQTAVQAAEVTLAWDANNPAPDGYQLFRRQTNDSYDYQNPVWSGSATTATQTGLMPDTTYFFVVRAIQGTEESGDSNEVEFRSNTPVPTTHTVTATAQTGGTISPSGDVSIEEGQDLTFTITPDSNQVISSVLVDGQSVGAVSTYTFSSVTADHTISAGFSPQNTQTVEVTLAWDANNPAPDGYKLFRRLANDSYDYQNPVWSGSDTTIIQTGLMPDTTYFFVVRAIQGTEESSDSNEVEFRYNTPVPTTHTVTATAQTGGTISPSGPVSIAEGQDQTFTITPDTHQVVSNVLVDGQSVGAVSTYTFSNVTADHTISASFTPQTFSINASAGANGAVSPSGSVNVTYGATPAFSVTPDSGYHVADVRVDGSSVGAVSSYTFPAVTADHTLAASFAVDTYTLSATAGANGSITPSGTLNADHGATQTFSIEAVAGYQIAQVYVDDQPVGAVSSYTFSNVTADHTIAASFSAIQHLITAQAGSGGSITPTGSVAVNQGATQSFTIVADNGYHVADVLVDGGSVGALETYTFENVQAAHSIEAGFELDNQLPVADAGPDQSVDENSLVQLSGLNSYDLDDGIAAFTWRQIEGPVVSLSSQSGAEVSFTAPETGPEGLALVFELQVTDQSGATATDTCIVNVVWVNVPPTAQAGGDQVVAEGQSVTLDGTNSADPDLDITTYRWEQTSGPAVVLSDAQAVAPTFTAPNVGPDGATLAFRLTVGDSGGLQDTDSTLVTVTWINTPPVADAGPDQDLVEGTAGSLDGSNSSDGDDGIAAYQWTQTDGPPVTLSDATAMAPTFTAPGTGPEGITLTFQLTVTDQGGLQHQDSCHVNVIWENLAPHASAGADQTVDEGSLVSLDGSASSDPDDGIAGYQWSQTGGPTVLLSDPQSASPTFTAPDVGMDGAALTFTLTVSDNGGLRAEDSCVVNVTWQNQPPVSQAGPDSQVYAEALATLDGSGSHDSDDGIAAYRWRQISGPPVSLGNPAASATTFTAPAVGVETGLVFELSVTDQGGLQSTDTCQVTVLPVSTSPDTTPPGIEITDPAPQDSTKVVVATSVTLRGIAWDDRQVDRIEWTSNRGPSGVATGTENWEITDIPLSRYSNKITVTVYDTAGNSTFVKLNVFAVIWR